jgi:hypothetical protein
VAITAQLSPPSSEPANRAFFLLWKAFHNRKNSLFAGHDLGAENWAGFATLIETCKLNDINPQAYLTDVLARIVLRTDADPVDDLLPYNWVDSRATSAAQVDQAA